MTYQVLFHFKNVFYVSHLQFLGEKEDGNIYTPENLRSFKKFVLANTDDRGVHFVMADGVNIVHQHLYFSVCTHVQLF